MKYLIILLFLTSRLLGTSYPEPNKKEVFSFNKEFKVIIDPITNNHKVYKTSIKDKEQWSFNLEVHHSPFIISNDGQVVATIEWKYIKDDTSRGLPISDIEAITFWKNGKKWHSIKLSSIFPFPPEVRGSRTGSSGDIWRVWYHNIGIYDNSFSVKLTNKEEVHFSLDTGLKTKNRKNIFPLKEKNYIIVKTKPYYDRDKDGISDIDEYKYKLNPALYDSEYDKDKDGFRNIDEINSGNSPIENDDHPEIINRCRIIKINTDKVHIINEINNKTFILKVNKILTLNNTDETKDKYKLLSIHKEHIILIDVIQNKEVKLTNKTIFPAPKNRTNGL